MKRLRKKFNTRLGFIIGFVLVVLTALALPYLLAGVGISLAALFVSTIIDQASGKLGDNVLSRNKAGNYIKKHRKPSNPKSDSQMNIRQWHQYLAKAWSSILSAGDRLAFDNYATDHPVPNKFGTKMERSGFQAFMRLNSKYGAIETAGIFNLPPTLPTAWPIIHWGAGATPSPDAFALTPIIGEGTLPDMTILVVKASSVVAVGINKPKTKTVFANSTTIADGISISLKNGWEEQYGSLATKIPSTGSWQIYLDIAIINGATGEQSMHLIARATNPVTP